MGPHLVIDFSNAKEAKEKAEWSATPQQITISKGGLGWDGAENTLLYGWIQTKPLALGKSWRPAASVGVRLEVSPVPKSIVNVSGQTTIPSVGSAFVRYSPDCKHWSNWQALAHDDQSTEMRAFEGNVEVPRRVREPYGALLAEYGKLDVPWKSDEEAAVAWILKNKPDYFEHTLPFIGYVEFLFEASFHGGQRITGLTVNLGYAMSGLHDAPKDEKVRENHHGPWRFKAK